MYEVGNRELIDPPAQEPFAVAYVKNQFRISTSSEDDLIERMIKTAREDAEKYLNRALITQTWLVKISGFPPVHDRQIELPLPKLQEVEFVKYYDENGDLITLEQDVAYEVITEASVGSIVLLPDQYWPVTQFQRYHPVQIQFIAGYGDNPSDIPSPIMDGMLRGIGDLYENRENIVNGIVPMQLPINALSLMATYRIKRFF